MSLHAQAIVYFSILISISSNHNSGAWVYMLQPLFLIFFNLSYNFLHFSFLMSSLCPWSMSPHFICIMAAPNLIGISAWVPNIQIRITGSGPQCLTSSLSLLFHSCSSTYVLDEILFHSFPKCNSPLTTRTYLQTAELISTCLHTEVMIVHSV